MFTIFYLVKLLFAKITKLWILSFCIQNNTFIYVWNKKEYQLCVSLYIFWSLNTRLKYIIWSLNTRLKNMPQSKNYSIQPWKMVVNMERYVYKYMIKRDRVFKLIKIYHIFRFKYAMVWMKVHVWKKSASIKNNSIYVLHEPYLYLICSTCLNLEIQIKRKEKKIF